LQLNTIAAGMVSALIDQFSHVLQLHNLPGDSARELFKPSKDLQIFESAMKKYFFGFGFQIFCG